MVSPPTNQVLIVEDDLIQAKLLELLLVRHGYPVRVAVDGEDALIAMNRETPSLVVTDIMMPRMDGYELCRRIKATVSWRRVPVIMVTQLAEAEDVLRGMQAGADSFITKPFNRKQLIQRIADLLQEPAPRDVPAPGAAGKIVFRGQTYPLSAQPFQLANLVLSTYESAVYQNAELVATKNELEALTTRLEGMAEQRAAALSTEIAERQLKDRFLSHVSHELRTPVAAIHQFTTILTDGLAGELNPEQREYLDIVLRNVLHLKRLIDDLLDVARARASKLTIEPRDVRLDELIMEALNAFRPMASTKGVRLAVDLDPELPMIRADPARVRQILNNLLGNALKFSPDAGNVTVRAERYTYDSRFVCVHVRDHGCGIKLEEQELIFNELYQVEQSMANSRHGLGLGLYISKELVNGHNGRIWVESKEGQGSTFSFTLPLAETLPPGGAGS